MLIRKMKEINDFLTKLSYETWDTIFSKDDVNKMFNSFLDSYLKIFYSSFPLKRVHITKKIKNKNWITLGILTSFNHACRNSHNIDLINHYKRYRKILSIVIKEATKLNIQIKLKNA